MAAFMALSGAAQGYASMQDSLRLAGCDYVYKPAMQKLTPAPKGYKALAIEHYGRHGARYCWQGNLYSGIRDVFRLGDSLGVLTPAGKMFLDDFEELYPEIRYHENELTRKGWEQQGQIAEVMYRSFPEIFKGRQAVRANCSNYPRCLMSMSAFCLSLSDCSPELDITAHCGRNWYPGVIPQSEDNPFARDIKFAELGYDMDPRGARKIYYGHEAILRRLFTDPEAVVKGDGQIEFIEDLFYFVSGMQSLDTDKNFAWIFTRDERFRIWEIDNFKNFARWRGRYLYLPILEDIIAKGDEHIAEGRKGADLRFGHDTCLIPLLMLLDVNGCGRRPDTWQEIKDVFQDWNIPMGGNIQFIIYRPKRGEAAREGAADVRGGTSAASSGGEAVLFKVLLNGEEAALPSLEAVSGPYYRWSDLKAMAAELQKHVR